MSFSGTVDNGINAGDGDADVVGIGDIALDEFIMGIIFNLFEVFQISGVCEFVQVDDFVIGVFS